MRDVLRIILAFFSGKLMIGFEPTESQHVKSK